MNTQLQEDIAHARDFDTKEQLLESIGIINGLRVANATLTQQLNDAEQSVTAIRDALLASAKLVGTLAKELAREMKKNGHKN